MKKKIAKILIIVFAGLILVFIALTYLNYYFFSVTGFLAESAGLCSGKEVDFPREGLQRPQLSFPINAEQIGRDLAGNSHFRAQPFSASRITIQRKFGPISYQIYLSSYDGQTEFSISSSGGRCSAPDESLRNDAYQMIDDLPLDTTQKNEMKKYVIVHGYLTGLHIF